MRRLVEVMRPGAPYTFAEIVELCRTNECLGGLVGEPGGELTNASRVTLARLLGRYDHRLVNNHRFVIEGKGHKRHYRVETGESDARSHALHAVSVQTGESQYAGTDQKERAERATIPEHPSPGADSHLGRTEIWL